jgi:hypothetical protein
MKPECRRSACASQAKASNMLRGMGLTHLSKNKQAIQELTEKGMAPE